MRRSSLVMPSGRTHLRIELVVLGLCAIGVAVLWSRGTITGWMGGAFLSSYLFSTLFLSPDLDLSYSRVARRWGWARFLWWPYAHIFRHRSVSHHLLLGPLTRILYLVVLFIVLLVGIRFLTGRSLHLELPSWPVIVAIVAGLYLPNQIHTIVDWLVSAWRRFL